MRRTVWTFAALYAALGMMHGYITVARYDPVEQVEHPDSRVYLAMSEGLPLEQAPRVYRWRVLTPMVVRHVPLLPEALTRHYQMDAAKAQRFRWAAWNTAGTVLAACGVMALMLGLGFGGLQAGVGGLLYATSFQAMAEGAMILVDPWANAAIAWGFWLGLQGRPWALGAVFAFGVFVKETLVLLPFWLALARAPRLAACLAAMAPGAAAYLWFRYGLYPGGHGVAFNAEWILGSLRASLSPSVWAYAGAEFALNFALLAPLAWLGWRDAGAYPALRRMAWVLPALLVAPFALGTELTRPWFNGFPVFIPLAVLGLWRLLAPPPAAPVRRTTARKPRRRDGN